MRREKKSFIFFDILHDTIKADNLQPEANNNEDKERATKKIVMDILSSSFNRRRKFIRNLLKGTNFDWKVVEISKFAARDGSDLLQLMIEKVSPSLSIIIRLRFLRV